MPDPIIRAATADDVEPVLALWQAAADDVDRPADTSSAVHALMTRDPEALIVAEEARRIVGTVVIGWDGWRGHIYRLAVDPSYRGLGVGSRLLEAAEQRARDQGCVRIDAIVRDGNTLAHRIWTREGYERQARWSRWVKQLDA